MHHWGNGEEKDCTCDPRVLCAVCDVELLVKNCFVVLDETCFGHANATLQ